MQAKAGGGLGKAGDAMKDAADKLHEKMQKMGGNEPPP
jgi:hypothetical protein